MANPHLSTLLRLRPVCMAILMASAAPLAFASHIGEDLTTDQATVQSSDQLLDALRQYESLPADARAAREGSLVRLAQARRDRLLRLLERNPQLAAARLLAPGLRERFPAAARAYLEEPASLRGSVMAEVADDFERGVSR